MRTSRARTTRPSVETGRQIAALVACVERLRAAGIPTGTVHAANSAGVLGHPDAWLDAVRPGLALYGVPPSPGSGGEGLVPAMALETAVVAVKSVPAGTPLGYGGRFVARRDTTVAVIPIGYHDGFRRSLSGKISVLLRGQRAPVVGAISMDVTLVDATDSGAERGDAVVCLGAQGKETVTAWDLARAAETIPYEILCGIGPRVARVYTGGNLAMAAKATTVFACQSCGSASPKWLGRCPDCGEWNSFVEEVRAAAVRAAPGAASPQAVSIGEIGLEQRPRLATGLPGFDRVLGGGLVPGSVVLLGGEPGIGKSTLLLQAGRGLAVQSRDVLYASAEESAPQVRLRGGRLGIHEEKLLVLAETDVSRIIAEAEARSPAVVVIDSVQAVREPSLTSAPGTVSQVRAAASELTRYAKSRGVPVLLVGHVTKDGSLAGPKSLEHLVDAVVSIEGDRGSSRRLLRATKNRFGPVDEIALYEMTGEGLSELPNASAALLAERRPGLPGSAVTAAREGARSVLVEIQALVGGASAGSPRRVGIGVDGGRLALLLAVLEGSGLALSSREIFVSCTGGLEVTEPAADLAIVAALVSSARAKPLPDGSVFFGEIGLLGEVRRVPAAVSRLKEAAALGFGRVFLPSGNAGDAAGFPDLACRPVDRVASFLAELGDGRR